MALFATGDLNAKAWEMGERRKERSGQMGNVSPAEEEMGRVVCSGPGEGSDRDGRAL